MIRGVGMMLIYFIGSRGDKEMLKGVADVFIVKDDGICYDLIRVAVNNGTTGIALGNANTFVAVDDYLCVEGLYNPPHDIKIFDTPADFFTAYKTGAPDAVLTDSPDFARYLKKMEASR